LGQIAVCLTNYTHENIQCCFIRCIL